MRRKKIKNLIQKPLRFHHQDIHEEIEDLKSQLSEIKKLLLEFLQYNVNNQMQKLQCPIDQSSDKTEDLWLSKSNKCSGGKCECKGSKPS